MCQLPQLPPLGALCGCLQPIARVRGADTMMKDLQDLKRVQRKFLLLLFLLVLRLDSREPREVELNGSCLECHQECQVLENSPTCSGPVSSTTTITI